WLSLALWSSPTRRSSDLGVLIIPFLMIPMALITAFTGAVELVLVYVPVVIPLMLKLGYDRITGTAIALISTIAGYALALTAPATERKSTRLNSRHVSRTY